jgi:hypothetical protein
MPPDSVRNKFVILINVHTNRDVDVVMSLLKNDWMLSDWIFSLGFLHHFHITDVAVFVFPDFSVV